MDFTFITGHGSNHSVCIKVTCGDQTLTFWSERQIPKIASIALEEAIDRFMANQITRIRKHAYWQGWDDAKKRQPKKTEFYNCLNGDPTDVGY